MVLDLGGDQATDNYWINPGFTAEHMAGKSWFAGKLYMQFLSVEPEVSRELPGVPVFLCFDWGIVLKVSVYSR